MRAGATYHVHSIASFPPQQSPGFPSRVLLRFDYNFHTRGGLKNPMNTISISRRKFAHLLAAGAAAAVVRPAVSFARQPEHATGIAGIVRLSANENPYGPSLKAHQAMQNSFE